MQNKTLWTRKIIHVDMDAFFAAVEVLDHPEYRGKPLIVGGTPDGRGVVSTASYEARKFGIHSAMPAFQAKKLCPQAIFVRPHFERYEEISGMIMAILRRHTEKVEPVSLDEAYLDVTHHRLGIQDPVAVAKLIKETIHAVTRLTASAGVAENCFLAKLASDFKKPDGLTVIEPGTAREFLKDLPVRKIPGVGPVTEKKLHDLDILTCSDLESAGASFLRAHLGSHGLELYEKSLGQDDREVIPDWEPRQISTEETFPRDTRDMKFLEDRLRRYAREVYQALVSQGKLGKTVVLKVKYHDFELITRSRTLSSSFTDPEIIFETASSLLSTKTQAGDRPIRLLGLGITGLQSKVPSVENRSPQLELFPNL